jgi:hypothetical protein
MLKEALEQLYSCESVGNVRGKGLLWAVEFAADRSTKQPFDPKQQFANLVAGAAMRRGLMTYPMQGCVDGINGDHLMIAPPAVITGDEIAWAVEKLNSAIDEVGTSRG